MARLRLFFSKSDRLQYISHLDLSEVINASVSRAQLPVAYTQGFHPRPIITLPDPLPLGYGAEDEPLEIGVTQNVDLKQVLSALNAAAPEGLRFHRAELVAPHAPKYASQAVAAEYHVVLPKGLIDDAALRAAFERFEERSEWIVTKETKSGVRQIDLKKSIHLGEGYSAREITLLVSMAQGRYIDPLRALSEILGRAITLSGGAAVTRRRFLI